MTVSQWGSELRNVIFMIVLAFPLTTHGSVVTTHLYASDDATLLDIVDDGQLIFNAAIGHGNPEWGYAHIDTRMDAVNSTDRFSRGGLEFNIAPFAGTNTQSATLIIQPYYARDLMTTPPWEMPTVELWGYVGSGFVSGTSLMGGVKLASFSPTFLLDDSDLTNGSIAFTPTAWATETFDVTDFVQQLIDDNEPFAGFRINIKDDLSGQNNLFSEFAYGVPGAIDPNNRPKLVLVSDRLLEPSPVPEPASLALVALGLVGLAASRCRKRA